MDLSGATIMILGGGGLVGHAIARKLLESRPKRIVLVSLTEQETREAAGALAANAGDTVIAGEFGDIYLPSSLAKLERATLMGDAAHLALLVDDIYGDLSDEVLGRSRLVQLLETYRPDAVVDCINTATAFAYDDVQGSARDLLHRASAGTLDLAAARRHALTLPMPRLTRHVQILREGLRRAGTRAYVKIGTSGTGGMGLNIPYTHSEERPSRTLLAKSAVAGAHTLLLYLLGRTPGAPATIEIKPTAAIGWREIAFGPVRRGGREVPLYDCPAPLPVADALKAGGGGKDPWVSLGRPLESVWINMGENGLFAREEFATITALGQMEMITPEEVADYVVMELTGQPTGHDVVAALDASTAGPTYRAGLLRGKALERLDQLEGRHRTRSIAFEMLGPPRLTKLLYEAFILSRLARSVEALANGDAAGLGREAEALLTSDTSLRAEIVSVGIGILHADGKRLSRGPRLVVTPPAKGDPLAAAPRGWVDLRESNCALWVSRARRMVELAALAERAPGSGSDRESFAVEPREPITPWRMAAWIFHHEDAGSRSKR